MLAEKSDGTYTSRRGYCPNKRWFCYSSDVFTKCFNEIQNVNVGFLKQNSTTYEIKKTIKILNERLIQEYPFDCEKHKTLLKNYFENKTIDVLVYSWCRSINRILGGKLTYHGDDLMKTAAQIYYNKYKHKKYNVKFKFLFYLKPYFYCKVLDFFYCTSTIYRKYV